MGRYQTKYSVVVLPVPATAVGRLQQASDMHILSVGRWVTLLLPPPPSVLNPGSLLSLPHAAVVMTAFLSITALQFMFGGYKDRHGVCMRLGLEQHLR